MELFPDLCEARCIAVEPEKTNSLSWRQLWATKQSPAQATRFRALDVLRGIAILLIIGPHTPFRFSQDNWASRALRAWRDGGWIGVDIFFVLSGFLIAGLLFSELKKNHKLNLRLFLVRRLFKIWPAYLAFLLVVFLQQITRHSGSFSQRVSQSAAEIWPFLVHIQNYYYSPLVERIGHTWSLAIEEHFYLLLPAVILLLMHLARRVSVASSIAKSLSPLPWICGGVFVISLALRVISWRTTNQFDEYTHHWPTHLRLDAMFVGVGLAYLVHFKQEYANDLREIRNGILLFGLMCMLPFAWVSGSSRSVCTFGYSLLQMGAGALVLCAWLRSNPGKTEPSVMPHILSPVSEVMSWIGRRSYSIYLWHMPFSVPVVNRILARVGLWNSPMHDVIAMAIYAGVCVGIGSIMYALIEFPAMAIREKLAPSTNAAIESETLQPAEPVDGSPDSDAPDSLVLNMHQSKPAGPMRRAV